MERLLANGAVLLFALSPGPPILADAASPLQVEAGLEIGYLNVSGYEPWTEGFVGKLRYSDSRDGLIASRGYIDHKLTVLDTLNARLAIEFYDDDLGAAGDVTEAFIEWRPVPRSENRYRLKFGAFYPRISFENVAAGWSSPYTLSSSTINSWVAEELRTFGAELTISRRLGGNQTIGLNGALFYGNDPAGSLLAWKGWSAHDRQTRLGDRLPLAPLPQLQPGGVFERQAAFVAPFEEIDDRPGYYLNAEWRAGNSLMIRLMHYDNRGDPSAFGDGQYAWDTRFDHVGVQYVLPLDIGAIAQWMRGSTDMGREVNGAHLVDTDFDSKFLLLTKAIDRHRLSLRYDHFDISQDDQTLEDNNPENGHVWTAAYQYSYSKRVSLAAEWLSIKTHHCGWVYYGIEPSKTERQLLLAVRLSFDN